MVKKTNRTYIGGQAVIQGVMMRGKEGMATVVRDDKGQVHTEAVRIPQKKGRFRRLPFVRGIFSFISSLAVGMKALLRSSEVALSEEEDEAPSKFSLWIKEHLKVSVGGILSALSTVIGVLLAVGLFMFLPQYLAGLIADAAFAGDRTVIWYYLIEGGFRLVVFICYILFTLCFKSLRETYRYHGAEHKTINCYEYGWDLTVENVKKCTRMHDRCGTTFIFIVLIISIVVFALVGVPLNMLFAQAGLEQGIWTRLLSIVVKLLCLPIVAGISYEILKLLSLSDSVLLLPFKAPGYLMQMLTTREPDDGMIECAIGAFKNAYALDNDPEAPEKHFATETKLSSLTALMKETFARYGIDGSDAEWILSLTLNIPRSKLSEERVISRSECKKIVSIFDERLTGRPLWYIFGDTKFYGDYTFKVDERVLIPRPETEILVREAIACLKDGDEMLDLCTGSGAIAVAVACETAKDRNISVVASDISSDALDVARENARINKANVTFVKSDLFDNVRGRFRLITANPPYVKSREISSLQKEIGFEPRIALDGGKDGLDFYRRIAAGVQKHIRRGGMIILECGEDQSQDVIKIFQNATRCEFAMIVKDLEGVARVVKIGF